MVNDSRDDDGVLADSDEDADMKDDIDDEHNDDETYQPDTQEDWE